MKNVMIDYLRDLNILIKKKLFVIGKKNGIINSPNPLQVRIFMYLYQNRDKSISAVDLAKSLKVSKVAISEALTKMVLNGNIIVKESEDDGRKKLLSCTDEGLKKMKCMMSSIDTLNKELLKNISNEEIEVFINVVNKMKRNLEEE